MEATDYVVALRERGAALLSGARTLPEAPIPTCPGWAMPDLVAHIGTTWGWSAEIVRTGARAERPEPPAGGWPELVSWAERRLADLLDTLTAADPESDCWTFGPPRTRLFWMRRQALETAVHAWDVQRASAHPEGLDPDLAADGLDEFLAVFLPRILRQRPDGWGGGSVRLVETPGGREWAATLTGEPEGGEVVLRGPAGSLYLWCMNRFATVDLEVEGDRAVAERWAKEVTF